MTAPQDDTNVELNLLGVLLEGDREAISVAVEDVEAADFSEQRARDVFEAVVAIDAEGRPVDVVTVAELLKSLGKLGSVGGAAFLVALPRSVMGAVAVRDYCRIIREKGARRRLRSVCGQIADLARAEEGTVPELMDIAGQKFNSLFEQRQRAPWQPMTDLVMGTLEMLDRMRRDGGNLGLATGFPDVDRVHAGMQAGELHVLAARPGVGKTSFAMQVAEHHACGPNRTPVAVLSLEMPAQQLVLRMAAARARVQLERLRRGRLVAADEERISEAMHELHGAPIFVDDSGDLSPLDIRAKARRLKQQHPALGLLVVDYLQLVKVRGRVESRQVEVAEVSRSLKALSKELAIPVLALAQLNRKVEERKGSPMLSDLRESGAIEQDADSVMFLHRERLEDENETPAGDTTSVEFHIAKQRNGPVGDARLVFRGEFARFENATHYK